MTGPRIDFYLLSQSDDTTRYNFACRLANKAYSANHRLYIHFADATEAKYLDKMLWTYQDNAFIPHQLEQQESDANCPIHLGSTPALPEQLQHNDILLNMAPDIPEFFMRFQRIIEISLNQPHWRNIARTHYRYYRTANSEISTHTIEDN